MQVVFEWIFRIYEIGVSPRRRSGLLWGIAGGDMGGG